MEEPKAPIVRIRKKKVKRKAKENDVVILPVRASQQARYSNLYPPPNTESKGRECCRHAFAGCMKIPVCRLVCFRCVLPSCYQGAGSDDEEAEIKDEGYHSQNRRSSEIPPPSGAEAAQGGSGAQEVEMTEIKTESTAPLIPPRNSVRVNEYRRQPNSNIEHNAAADGDLNYIEVESVGLNSVDASSNNIPDTKKSKKHHNKEFERVLEAKFSVNLTKDSLTKTNSAKSDVSYYSEGDLSDDSESNIYVNEDALKPRADSDHTDIKQPELGEQPAITEDKQYVNLDNVDTQDTSRPHSTFELQQEQDTSSEGMPRVYVNFPPADTPAGEQELTDQKETSVQQVNVCIKTNQDKLLEKAADKREKKVDEKYKEHNDSNTMASTREIKSDTAHDVGNTVEDDATVHVSDSEQLIETVKVPKLEESLMVPGATGESSSGESTDDETGDQTKLI
ncbi:uncharacterized protein LOC128219329 [Mya arenaria]|uniref:uncharacterized protein LOC128219329 n=1 Tax=Mya arenaria TaxID=6604 RepID=UPI0022E32620|nr:uncharacterized protein LOC128219329 [Mya arenaria]XP_052783108.1 uncharacterized protein LOC128219329 [Mya arenaria]